jgi:hypothetical protein
MITRGRRAGAGVLAVLLCVPLTAFGWGDGHRRYLGTEYDLGGVVHQIDGPQMDVQQAAQAITASTTATLAEVAAHRDTLAYGGITAPAGEPRLVTYPGPDGIEASPMYAVTVQQQDRSQPSFVYYTTAKKTDTNIEKDTSWTSFSFRGRVTVHVTALDADATGCIVRPTSAAIHTTFADGTCTFSLTRPRNVSVEFAPNTTNPVLHPMLVFANPLEADAPDPHGPGVLYLQPGSHEIPQELADAGDPDVLYFAPGVHDIGALVPLRDDETIYLAGGAWVRGTFKATGPVHNFTIRGRGVLDGSFLDTGDQTANKGQPGMIDIADQSSSTLLVEGITLANAVRFNVRALGKYTTIENVKIIDWWYSSDGMVGGNSSLLENNFIKVNDDSIKLFWGDTVARHNTIWQLENGAPFMISWNIHVDSRRFHVYDNDVIHADHYKIKKSAIFRALHATEGHLGDYLFEDIRVEAAHFRLFDLTLDNNKWYDPSLGWGSLDTLIFRNIHADGPFSHAGLIHGADADHLVSKVALQNVSIGGTCLADAEDGNIDIDPASTDAISITHTPDCGAHT